MNRYELRITLGAQEIVLWTQADSESHARQQVHIAVQRDSITKRMNTEHTPKPKHTVTTAG